MSYTSIKDVLNSMDTHERQQLLQRCINCMHKITSDKAETDQTQAVLMLLFDQCSECKCGLLFFTERGLLGHRSERLRATSAKGPAAPRGPPE